MMRKIGQSIAVGPGAKRPEARAFRPQVLSVFVVLGCAGLAVGCGSQEKSRNLDTEQVGLTPDVPPIFEDDESQLFEVKRGLQFPILAPTSAEQSALDGQVVEPYGRKPWITNKDVKVQLTWTISNLDEAPHVVEMLVDPWNEFGRYYPGMNLVDADEEEFKPNFSGIDRLYVLEGKSKGASSRRHGTCTFDDMNEMAIDFATVQNMIKFPPPLPNGAQADPDDMTDPLPTYANHAFNFINHSYNDPLVAPYIPAVIAGLTGVDFGFRTTEKATIALDVQIEVVDLGEGRVQDAGSNEPLLEKTTEVVTVGSPVPGAMVPASM
ncbi:MAG TPA: hypothetical protein VHM25_27215 [Polyangiaceae bacterium]|jgi:hypothetical protein|nr:hypothetical protein [Polyangiaceae bacterium]